ncbi:Tho complex subunit 7-domain-containing protein [Epithele typhae]|uniref:Tho complex subunit 7-domain-containing protein n=1 Tax=Epithele typhae TaxID=378194 RepID=UPI0020086DCF|nr:Tho complex subunit 7-domain-containing protein [Epithele typhae]KAH9943161.1 Tho complex subunit 7-domain-containing protein [Epithele typhae]
MNGSAGDAAAEKAYVPPPLTVQQEDAIINTRITNDEKALRRVTKKFHHYTVSAFPPAASSTASSVDDAREAFLLELASFQLSLQKSMMVCEAEARQVEEYQRERDRISNEHSRLKDQINELKAALEHAQLERKQKIEYDVIAEKVNSLPSRDELEQSIQSLENDMIAIRAEHENQNRLLQAQKAALDTVVQSVSELRLLGKDVAEDETPAPEAQPGDEDVEMDGTGSVRTREESGELKEEPGPFQHADGKMLVDGHDSEDDVPLAKTILNPAARTPAQLTDYEQEQGEIEHGEIEEQGEIEDIKAKRKAREDLEEGEASDESSLSDLSEMPDD